MLTLTFEPGAEAGDVPPGREVNTWADEAGRVFARAFVEGNRRWIVWQRLGLFTFTAGATDVRVRPLASASPAVVSATFDRVIQPVILQALGWQALHGSGVSGPNGALLFCGLGRSGKSTLAYAAARHNGYVQIADDAIVIGEGQRPWLVHPLPFAMGLRQDAIQRFEKDGARPEEHGRPHGTQESMRPVVAPKPLPVRAVFVLSQDAAAPSGGLAVRVPPVDAFPILLTHAHCFDQFDAGSMRRMIETYLAMADGVPVYALSYRPDFDRLDALVNTVIDTARSNACS